MKYCHARESGHPEIPEKTGFRVALRLHGMTQKEILHNLQRERVWERVNDARCAEFYYTQVRVADSMRPLLYENSVLPSVNTLVLFIGPPKYEINHTLVVLLSTIGCVECKKE